MRPPQISEIERWVLARRALLEGIGSGEDYTGGFGLQAAAWDGLSQLDEVARDAPGSFQLGGSVGKVGLGRSRMPLALLWAGHPAIRLRAMAAMRPWAPMLAARKTV